MGTSRSTMGALLLVATALLACKQGEKEAKQLEAISAKACACPDKACAEGTLKEFETALVGMKDAKATQEYADRISKASGEATQCMINKGVAPSAVLSTLNRVK